MARQHIQLQVAATRPPVVITQLRPQAITLPRKEIGVNSSPAVPNSVRLPLPIPQWQAFVTILPRLNPPPPNAVDEPSHETETEPPTRQEGDDFHGWPDANPFVADTVPSPSSDGKDDIPEHPPAPERRGLRPKRRPDPLHYEGKGVQRKKQDDNNSHV
jgi:hypothetical protein